MTRVLPPLYQLAVAPDGSWRLRLYNLPEHQEGKVSPMALVRHLAARSAGATSAWHKDPAEQLTVLRLMGPCNASLRVVLRGLALYGINQVSRGPTDRTPPRRK